MKPRQAFLGSEHPTTLSVSEWFFFKELKPSPVSLACRRVKSSSLCAFPSQNDTFLLPLVVPLLSNEGQSSLGGLSENVLHVLLILCRTFEVELCIHLLPGLLTLCVSDGSLIHGLELPRTLFVLPEVSLAANQDDRNVLTEVPHLWEPLYQDVLKAGGVGHIKAD